MSADVAQSLKNFEFLVDIYPKGYIPLSDFYKIWRGGGSPRFAPSRLISALYVLKCGF